MTTSSSSASASGVYAAAKFGWNLKSDGTDEPCKTCYDDPKCYGSEQTQTVANYLSPCRMGHGAFFLAYALLLLITVILVWLCSNGSITTMVSAWSNTIIASVVIILMALHWGLYMKGVIPNCCKSTCKVFVEKPEAEAKSNFRLQASLGAKGSANGSPP